MTVRIENNVVSLEGSCGVADAETLFAALSDARAAEADLSACLEMHGALAQILIRFAVPLVGEPRDAFLRNHVAPALERRRRRELME